MTALHDLFPGISSLNKQEIEDFFQNPWSLNKIFDVDVKETEKFVTIKADLPGFKKEEIQIELEDYTLTIKAYRNAEKEEKGEKYYKQERQYGQVERSIPLPVAVIGDASRAKYEDGVLTIILEKKNPTLPHRQSILIE
jgi:HSP20 family protein